MLRSRAGYRSARPIISRSSHSACNARPVHTEVPDADIAPPYSTISSARASNVCGTVSPIALAVFRLIASSNLVGS